MNSNNNTSILIIGASGFIGRNIFYYLKKRKYRVYGTYFNNKKRNLFFFDVKKNVNTSLKIKEKLKYLIIANAINVNLDETKKKFKKSYYINFIKTKDIIDYCFKNNIIPVYISSDAVFSGSKGNYIETDIKNPINSYGLIKHKVEKYIVSKKKNFLIVRISKVFGVNKHDNTLLTNLLKKMKSTRKIFCSYDQKFSPIFVDDFSIYLEKLIKKERVGIYHFRSLKKISIFNIAQSIKDFFNLKDIEIIPKKINSFNIIDKRPLLNTLSTRKFDSIFNVKYNELDYYLRKIKINAKKNS